MNGEDSPAEISGHIKWFDPSRGFGFVIDAQGGPDVLLHANVLRNFGRSSVADGAFIRTLVIPSARGRQAVEVLEIRPSEGASPPAIADLAQCDPATLEALRWQPARVKWFDKAKGFGFANIFGERGDVFLHVEVLRHGGFADLAVGEAIALRVVRGQRGPMAAQIAPWDRCTTAGAQTNRDEDAHLDGTPRLAATPAP